MPPRIRFLVAGLAGALVAFLLVAGIEALGHYFYPPPAGVTINNPEQLRLYLLSLPLGPFLFVLTAWFSASFAGALTACIIARTRPLVFAGVIGVLVLAGAIATLFTITHPLWFTITALVGIPIFALLASRLARKPN